MTTTSRSAPAADPDVFVSRDTDGAPDWIWREDALRELLADHGGTALFVSGCKTNQGAFYPYFEHVVLLSAPAEILLARIAARTTNG